MSRATVESVSRPERYSLIAAMSFPRDAACRLAAQLHTAGAQAWVCKRRGLVVLHGARRLRLVHDPCGPPATLKTIVGLIESGRHIDPIGRPPWPPKERPTASPETVGLKNSSPRGQR